MIMIKLHDEGNDAVHTTVDVDFLGVRIVARGVLFTFTNNGPLTAHFVSLWIVSSTVHDHYNLNEFINSGENGTYILVGVQLPSEQYFMKAYIEVMESSKQEADRWLKLAKKRVKRLGIKNHAQFLFKLRYPAKAMVSLNDDQIQAFKNAGFNFL